ncbi:MAG: hypothetical protein GTN81_03760 [Proteobacteria bacterium]|nr:hypothetical protein [Pseudomonadota bacterium]
MDYRGAWYHIMNRGRRDEEECGDLSSQQLRKDSLKRIGEQFEMGKYSSVSRTIERTKALIPNDRKLRKRIGRLLVSLIKSQNHA